MSQWELIAFWLEFLQWHTTERNPRNRVLRIRNCPPPKRKSVWVLEIIIGPPPFWKIELRVLGFSNAPPSSGTKKKKTFPMVWHLIRHPIEARRLHWTFTQIVRRTGASRFAMALRRPGKAHCWRELCNAPTTQMEKLCWGLIYLQWPTTAWTREVDALRFARIRFPMEILVYDFGQPSHGEGALELRFAPSADFLRRKFFPGPWVC